MDSSLLGSWICLASLRDVPRPGHEKIALDSISIADSDLPVVPIGRSQPALIVSTNHPQIPHIPHSQEGRFAIVTNVEYGMRWTRTRN
jgi:hypothetical protein